MRRHQARARAAGVVYVVRLERPIGNPASRHGSAQFYVGWTERDPEARLAEHRAGRGAKMLAAAAERGIRFDLVMTLPGTRRLERRIKDHHNTPRLLPQWAARFGTSFQPREGGRHAEA